MNEDSVFVEAMQWFSEWIDEAKNNGIKEHTAASLATVGGDGCPSLRTVLLKAFDQRGFVFYTNLRSIKARQLQANPQVAMSFFWVSLGRQILIEGRVRGVTDAEADAYFASRPRDSQIGAWASQQSQTLGDRAELEQRFEQFKSEYEGQPVPRPSHWSGYRIVAHMIEFWQGQAHRLHQRYRYRQEPTGWVKSLLNP